MFRHDDPFWATHYPPNGWNCRCRVRPLTKSQVEARGLTVSRGARGLHPVTQRVGVDKRTGEEITTEGVEYRYRAGGRRHVLLPDAGWSYNPGAAAPLYDAPAGDPTLRSLVVEGQRTWQGWGLPARVPAIPAPPRLPAAPDAAAAKRRIAERLSQPGFEPIGITRADSKRDVVFSRVETPAGLEDVYVTESFVDHIVDHKKDHRERFADWILPSLRDPAEVWLTEVTDGRGRKVYRRRFITAFEGTAKDKPTIAVTQEGKDGSLAWTFHRRDARSMDSQRSGFLLYRRPREEGG